jgi:hypothetical protein
MAAPTVSAGPVARLLPDDLKFAPEQTPPRRLRCRLLAIDVRRTQKGQSWAWLDLVWQGRVLRAAVFPSHWRALRAVPDLEVGAHYVVVASVRVVDGIPLLQVHELREQALRLVPGP